MLPLALIASPAAAETQYQSTMTGGVKVEMAAQDAKRQGQPKAGDTLTIRFVPPPKTPAEVEEDDSAQKLEQCGKKWNEKLAAYEKLLPKLKKYIAYYDKWASHPAQRPPKLGEPLLTRESYRACMYACLGDSTAACPGGWAADTADKK